MLPKCILGGCLAARHSKANKQARLEERKICFISDAGNWRGGWQPSVQRPTPPSDKQAVRAFTEKVGEGGTTCTKSAVIPNSPLQVGHQWSDQHHLGCSRCSFSVLGALVPNSLRSILRIVAAQVLGTVWSSRTW